MYDATLQSNPKIEPRINFLFHFKFKDNVFDFPGRFTLAFHSVCWFQEEERSFIPAISIAPLQVLYYSEALPTTARILYRLTPSLGRTYIGVRSYSRVSNGQDVYRRPDGSSCF